MLIESQSRDTITAFSCQYGQGFLLLLFPWARNFTPIASANQLLNRDTLYINMHRAQLKNSLQLM